MVHCFRFQPQVRTKTKGYGVTNGYWYLLSMLPIPIGNLVAFHFDEFFFKEFSKPPKTNGNLILAALLVESNTMVIYCMIRVQNCELTFERNKICFYGKTQREFTYLTSEASLLSEFKLSFAKNRFCWVKEVHSWAPLSCNMQLCATLSTFRNSRLIWHEAMTI